MNLDVLRKNALNIALVLVAAAVALSTVTLIGVSGQAGSNCQQVQRLKGAISIVVEQSIKTLGVKGSAGYQYYRAHPDELAAAKTAGAEELRVFTPRSC